jgi:hypothetical protein
MSTENPNPVKPDPEKYNRLVAHAKVQAIRLIGTRYDIKPTALSASRDRWDYKISHRLVDWHCDNDSLLLRGTWEYTASCVEGRRKLLTVVATYLVTYRLNAVCDEEAGRQFLERVGRFAAYPYFRGTFALLTQQSGIMLHPLPIISEQPRWVTPPDQTGKASEAIPSANPTRRGAAKRNKSESETKDET